MLVMKSKQAIPLLNIIFKLTSKSDITKNNFIVSVKRELLITMCLASNPYRQPNTLLLEFDESLINAATVSQASPSKREDASVKKHISWSKFIRLLILVCFFPIVLVILYGNIIAQREEIDAQMDAIQATMLRIHALRDR